MRAALDGTGDIRFSCKREPTDAAMSLDLVFYQVPWYQTITTGSDTDSCFNQNDGAGYTPPAPARREVVSSTFLRRGDEWEAGYLEAEDFCSSQDDFTIDLDSRGMDTDTVTDWGEDDGNMNCGGTGAIGAGSWFIWVREGSLACADGVRSDSETDVDCGGECRPCANDAACVTSAECQSSWCDAGTCRPAMK
jgi:hypothetical protein